MSTKLTIAAALVWLVPSAPPAVAQGIAERIATVRNGTVELAYTSRPGVCGDGAGSVSWDGGHMHVGSDDDGWRGVCVAGPAWVRLELRDGEPTTARVRVGPRPHSLPAPTLDLGRVSAPAAASFFLSLAARGEGRVAEETIMAAELADSATVWPAILRIAQDDTRPHAVHESAMFWLAHEVADKLAPRAADTIDESATDAESVKRSAVFALSQQPRHEGVPLLLDVARTNSDPSLRRQAVFWLGQSGDPRALEFFAAELEGK